MKKVGGRYQFPLQTLHDKSAELYQSLGDGEAHLMTYCDRTHFTEAGKDHGTYNGAGTPHESAAA